MCRSPVLPFTDPVPGKKEPPDSMGFAFGLARKSASCLSVPSRAVAESSRMPDQLRGSGESAAMASSCPAWVRDVCRSGGLSMFPGSVCLSPLLFNISAKSDSFPFSARADTSGEFMPLSACAGFKFCAAPSSGEGIPDSPFPLRGTEILPSPASSGCPEFLSPRSVELCGELWLLSISPSSIPSSTMLNSCAVCLSRAAGSKVSVVAGFSAPQSPSLPPASDTPSPKGIVAGAGSVPPACPASR